MDLEFTELDRAEQFWRKDQGLVWNMCSLIRLLDI